MTERQDQWDRLLEEALNSYANAPETEGLEQRILARVAESARRTHPVRRWVPAISAALIASAAYLFWCVLPHVQSPPATTTITAGTRIRRPAPPAISTPTPPLVLRSAMNVRRFQRAPAKPKLPRFPTPSPMSPEEHALLQLITSDTKRFPKDLLNVGGPITPIQITELEVKPLRSENVNEGRTCCDQ
ncbi:MAG: hypothetical protein JO097_17290 [Acidobacteriaceae bacterium]|nr:hypothetical protein [Acidobacteriaceae bacterium]MBV9296017.1 hypothetical protein [Acidobacteriaceae bacterium]MBV9765268.1 hypothetical protein [Acidobacteriaceae bacterium]